MIKIEANTLYTRTDLAELLEGSGVDVDHFIRRISARKVFRMLWLGADILEGLRTAPALADTGAGADPETPPPPARNRGNRTPRGNQPAGAGILRRMARGES